MKNFHELTDRALSTKLNADYTRLAEGRQRFIFEKTLEILNESDVEMRSLKREEQMIRDQLKEREFSQEARPAPEQETLYGKAVGTVADWIRELPRAGARASQAVAPDFEWIESQMRSAGMFGPGQRSMGTTTREREESVAKRVADIEKYQKDLEAKGIKSWQDIQEPEQEIAALKAYQEQRAKAEGPTRPGEKGPDVPTLQRKYELKAYSEFQERTKGKSTEELKKYYEENPQQFASDEQFMSNKMATDVVPMEVATERPEGALPKGVQSGSAQTLKDVGENLPTITAIGGAAALAPGAAAAIARTALPLARVSPETAAQATRTGVGGAFAAMGAKDVATATDPVKLGLGATMLLPAAGAISRGAQAVAGMPSGPSPIQTAMFGRALAKARKAQEKFIERAKEQESMAQREVKTGTKEAQDVVWSGRETQGIPKVNPEKFELPSEASARPEWAAQDKGEKGRLSNQEYQALMRQFIDRIWSGDIFTADAMRAAGRRAAVERMTAETELPPAERRIPSPQFKEPAPVFGEIKPPQVAPTAEKRETQEIEAPAKPAEVTKPGVMTMPGDIAAQQARNIKNIRSLLFRGAEKLTRREPLRPQSRMPNPIQRAVWSAQDFVKDLLQNLKNAEPRAVAVSGAQLGALTAPLPEPSLPRAVSIADVAPIKAPEPTIPSKVTREAPKEQPIVPKETPSAQKNVEVPFSAGGMNRPVSLSDEELEKIKDLEEPETVKATTQPPPELLPEPSKPSGVSPKPPSISSVLAPFGLSTARAAKPSEQPIAPEEPLVMPSGPSPAAEVLAEPTPPSKLPKSESPKTLLPKEPSNIIPISRPQPSEQQKAAVIAPVKTFPEIKPVAAKITPVSSKIEVKEPEKISPEKEKTPEQKDQVPSTKDTVIGQSSTIPALAAATVATIIANTISSSSSSGGKGTSEKLRANKEIGKGGVAGAPSEGDDFGPDEQAEKEEPGLGARDWNLLIKDIYSKYAGTLSK